MKKRNLKKGFTIVELVIVIAVIAILSAVLIPTFSGVVADAQEKADMQTARNLYVEYLASVDAQVADNNGSTKEEVGVVVGEGEKIAYYLVTNGEIEKVESLTDATNEAASSYDVKIESGKTPVNGSKKTGA